MKNLRLFVVVLSLISLSACSRFGRGGKGSGDDMDGNIPNAAAGSVLADVNFAFDSSALDSHAQSLLTQNGKWLQANTGATVVVEGHCDERGTQEYNLALGERRARSAYDYLRSLGVNASRMSTISYGEELPLDPGHTEAAWAKNRRAHFTVKK